MFLRELRAQARRRTEHAAAVLAAELAHVVSAAREAVDAYRPVPMSAVRVLAVIEAAEVRAFERALYATTDEERRQAIEGANVLIAALEAARSVL